MRQIFSAGAAPDLEELLRCPVTSGRNAAAQSLAKLIAAYDPTRCAHRLLPLQFITFNTLMQNF